MGSKIELRPPLANLDSTKVILSMEKSKMSIVGIACAFAFIVGTAIGIGLYAVTTKSPTKEATTQSFSEVSNPISQASLTQEQD